MIPAMALPDGLGLRSVVPVDSTERAEPSAGPRQEVLARLQRIGLAMRTDSTLAAAAGVAAATRAVTGAVTGEVAPESARTASPAGLPAIEDSRPSGGALPASTPRALAAGETATLSSVGRWVDALLRMAPTVPEFRVGSGRVLLSNNVKTDTSTLTGVLQRTVETTGLFYEAHLAEWARGERFIENLQLEPQFDWQPPPATTTRAAEGPPLEQVGLLAQQLNALDQQKIIWNGEAWPGQALEWELARDTADPGESADGAESGNAWRTVLRLELPLLGMVTATIRLDGDRVGVTLTADRDATAIRLSAGAGELVDRLSAAGIATTGLNVERHDAD